MAFSTSTGVQRARVSAARMAIRGFFMVGAYVRLRGLIAREQAMFFFEKKNQKTFTPSGSSLSSKAVPRKQKFFASFFSKKEVLLLR